MSKLVHWGAALAASCIAVPALAQAPVAPPMPPMGAHADSRDQVVAHVGAMFARLDSNRDGFVTRDETRAERRDHRVDVRKRIIEHREMMGGGTTFDSIDANRDGVITRDEFALKGRLPGMASGPKRITLRREEHGPGGMAMHGRMLEHADANRDGKVSLQEATAAALRHFDSADANRDGRLTPDERGRMHQRMKGRRRPA
jgi:hypothetical protein